MAWAAQLSGSKAPLPPLLSVGTLSLDLSFAWGGRTQLASLA